MRAHEATVWEAMFESVASEGRWIGAESPVHDWFAGLLEHFRDRDDRVVLLAEVDGSAVGWISVELVEAEAEIGMGIVEGYRRQGIGTALMEAAIAWARGRAGTIRLDVFPHNEAAIGLYTKLGFVETARRQAVWPRRNGERWDLITMQRRVDHHWRVNRSGDGEPE